MDISDKQIWQVAAGDKDRNYVDLCLQRDVIIWGPGSYGPWPNCETDMREERRGQVPIGRRFCEEIKENDIIVLRMGTSQIFGVGEAIGPVLWLDDFGDIDGWDLQMVRRVRWLWKYSNDPQTFPPYTLKFGDTVLRMDAPDVISWLSGLEVTDQSYARDLVSLPESCVDGKLIESIDSNEISDFLFDQGISADSIDSLLNQMGELVRIANWYNRTEQDTSEHETVSYLVVPLLRALGWTPQKMAVEWKGLDIALFDRMPRKDDHIVVVVEAKKRGNSCLTAKSQAETYAEQAGREHCKRLIVTDGLRYGLYVREMGEKFSDKPQAYLNLTRMVRSYPILQCDGAKEALLLMAADWSG